MLRGHLAKSQDARGQNGFGAFLELFLHLGTRVSCARRFNDHRIERAAAPEHRDLASILFRRGQQALDVKPVRIGQRERRRHENDLGKIFVGHGVKGRLHRAVNVGFVQMRVHVDVRTERGDWFVWRG
ncbi:MAG: hypothetical protein DMG32_19950 [Acidobacteria bacterium]|nr:MAG: hypothetical protein DMG32_19950 [Acidobacteriota bacterium]